jgi:hypothetical protein
MNFLPAIPLSAIPADEGSGGVAVNVDGTLLASVHCKQHCVYLYSFDGAGKHAADPVVYGTCGTSGSLDGELTYPLFACFVHRNGVDSLLICDSGNDRVVEVSASGAFLRAIAVKARSHLYGIAYCGIGDVIALSLCQAHAVVLLQYETGAVKPEVTIGSGTAGNADGQLYYPQGIAFTADGLDILVADHFNHRVSKFSAVSGSFISHVATEAANGIRYPSDVLHCEDGSIVVAHGALNRCDGKSSAVVFVGKEALQNIIIPRCRGSEFFFPHSLSYSVSLNGVVVKTLAGSVFLLHDAWMCSTRCTWLSALATF